MAVSQTRAATAAQHSYQGPIPYGGYNPAKAGIPWTAIFWADDPEWTKPADGAQIDWWRDGGAEQKGLVQAATGSRPRWYESLSGMNDRAGVVFDGTDDFMATADWSAPLAGCVVAVVMRFRRLGVAEYVMDGNDLGNRCIFRKTAANGYIMSQGTNLGGGATNTDRHFGQLVFSSSTVSQAIIDDATVISPGNAGTNNLDGLTVASVTGGSTYASLELALLAVAPLSSVVSHAAELATLTSWIGDYYNIST